MNDPDVAQRNGQHDPAQIPEVMQAQDSHTQDDLHAMLYTVGHDQAADHFARFQDGAVKTLKLSTMRRAYERKDNRSALSWLRTRSTVQVDGEYILDPDGGNVLPSVGPHFLDFCLFIGDRLGLDALLPNTNHDFTFSFDLCFKHWNVVWPSADSRYLPFNPKGRMLKIGSRRQENVWLAMVPRSYLDHDHLDNLPDRHQKLEAPTNAMKFEHSLMVMMFFAWALEDQWYRDLHCRTMYPEPLRMQTVKESTEIL